MMAGGIVPRWGEGLLRGAAPYVAGILLGALLGAVTIALMGASVPLAFRTAAHSSLGSLVGLGQTLNKATPLLLGGLAVALGLRGGCFNIGVDGQIYMGAIAATGVAFALDGLGLPGLILVPAILVAGVAGGLLLGGVPGVLRAGWGVNEIFVTVMLNFVMVFFTDYLTTGPWNDPMAGEAISRPISEGASLPLLSPTTGTHPGILLALGAALLVWLLLERTALGFAIQAVGDSARAAQLLGLNVRWITLFTLAASGGLAGLAGAIEVTGFHNRLILGLSPGYGVMAILIAVLGKSAPRGVVVASLGMAVLLVGSDSLQRSVGLPASAALVFQAIVVLTMLLLDAGDQRSR